MDKRIIAIGFLTFVNVLGFAVLIPVLPFVVENYGAGIIVYGVLIAAYPIFQFLAAPALGTLSDHYGRRPILIVSQAGTMISWLIFASSYLVASNGIGPDILPLLVIGLSRVVDGITGGNFSVANAYISDITKREERTKVFGIIGAIVGMGLIVGPVLGAFLNSTSFGYLAVTMFAFVLSLVTLILMYFLLPETLKEENRVKILKFNILQEINIVAKINSFDAPNIRKLFFTRAFFALAFSSYTSTIVLFMKDILGLTAKNIGILFFILGSFFIFNQSILTPFLSRRIGDMKTFYVGQFCMFIGLILIMFVDSVWAFLPVIYIANLGFSSSFPTFKSIITDLVDEKHQGAVTGVDESVLAGASAIAPLAASIIFSFTGQYAYGLFSLLLLVPFVLNYKKTGKLLIRFDS